MTKKTKIFIICDSCGNKYEIEIDTFGDIDWKCPKCHSSENTYITDVEKDEDEGSKKPDKYKSVRPKSWL